MQSSDTRALGQSAAGAGTPDTDLYTLEPLRILGPDALDPQGALPITRITLRALEVTWEDCFYEKTTLEADDLFRSAATEAHQHDLIPPTGRLTAATFEIQFADAQPPRLVRLRPPATLTLATPADAQPVNLWLAARGFLKTRPPPQTTRKDFSTLDSICPSAQPRMHPKN